MKLLIQGERLIDEYVRSGAKEHRREQRERMLEFLRFCAAMGAFSLAQIGKRHCIAYWKQKRGLAPATLYAHWRAMRDLWKLAGKPDEPPKPFVILPSVSRVELADAATADYETLLRKWEDGGLFFLRAKVLEAAGMKPGVVLRVRAIDGCITISVSS